MADESLPKSLKDPEEISQWLFGLVSNGIHESPIDVNVGKAEPIQLPPLTWKNHDKVPKKMKLTNTGHTVILSGKWQTERPYICGGPLIGNYVFSQMHIHWGANDMEGSEHTAEGKKYAMELHVVCFKSAYLTQEAALKERDGIVLLVYFFKAGDSTSLPSAVIDAAKNIEPAVTSAKISPFALSNMVKQFKDDYLFYWGAISGRRCNHHAIWCIYREALSISSDDLETFRLIKNKRKKEIKKNCRKVAAYNNRKLVHVSPGNIIDRSEHTADGSRNPAELHALYFKESYQTHELALKQKDGIVMLVYFYQIGNYTAPLIQLIRASVREIIRPHTSSTLLSMSLDSLLTEFTGDYLLYFGSVTTALCSHHVLWLISRVQLSITSAETELLRGLYDENFLPMERTFKGVDWYADESPKTYHVNPSTVMFSTLLPLATPDYLCLVDKKDEENE